PWPWLAGQDSLRAKPCAHEFQESQREVGTMNRRALANDVLSPPVDCRAAARPKVRRQFAMSVSPPAEAVKRHNDLLSGDRQIPRAISGRDSHTIPSQTQKYSTIDHTLPAWRTRARGVTPRPAARRIG